MKKNKKKINFLRIVGFIFIAIIFFIMVMYQFQEKYSATINQIQTFYSTSIKNDTITSIIELPYPGRGTYKSCYIEESDVSLPLILENNRAEERIKNGVLIFKDANSYKFSIKHENNVYVYSVRDLRIELNQEIKNQGLLIFGFILLMIISSILSVKLKK